MNVAVLIMAATVAVTVLLALQARRGQDIDLEQWAVGGRGLGSVLVFLLLAGEIFTVYTLLGGSGVAYAHGASVYYILAYCAISYNISYFLLPPIWRYGRQHGLLSQADFLAHKYGSKGLGNLVALVGVAALIPYVVLQLKGLGIVVSAASYGFFSPHFAVWVGVAVMILYVMIAGIKGSTRASTLKDGLVLAVAVFAGCYIPHHYYGGLGAMFRRIDAVKPGFLDLPAHGMGPTWYVTTVALTSLGFFMWPQFFPAIFASRDARVFRRNAILLPLYSMILLFVFFVGFAAVVHDPGLEGADTDLALFKISLDAFPPWCVGLIGAAGVLTALVPGSIIVMTTAMLIANNLLRIALPAIDDRKVLSAAKSLVPVIAVAGGALAVGGAQAMVTIQLMGFAVVAQFFWAVLASIGPGRGWLTAKGAVAGILTGVTLTVYATATHATLVTFLPLAGASLEDVNMGLASLVTNLAVALAVSIVERYGSGIELGDLST